MTQESLIILLNDQGQVIGSKPRNEIDKVHDIVHCTDVLLMQSGELILSRVPEGNLYGGLLSASCATMVRVGEEAEAAAHRALQKELNIDTAQLTLLGEHFFTYPDGVKRLKTTFAADFEGNITANPKDIAELVYLTRDELEGALKEKPEQFAPTFLGLWEVYQHRIF